MYTLNPNYSCGQNIETTIRYLLYCPNYSTKRMARLCNLKNDKKIFMTELIPDFQR